MINLVITVLWQVRKCWGFGQERGDYPQIRGGKKNWWRNPWISFSSFSTNNCIWRPIKCSLLCSECGAACSVAPHGWRWSEAHCCPLDAPLLPLVAKPPPCKCPSLSIRSLGLTHMPCLSVRLKLKPNHYLCLYSGLMA